MRRRLGTSGWNAAWVTGATFAVRVVGLVASVLLARYLDPEGFGLYSTVLAYLALALAVGTLGLDRLLLREASAHAERAHLFSTVRAVCLLATGVVVGGFLLLGIWRGETLIWTLAGLAVLPAIDAALIGALFNARERFDVTSMGALVQIVAMTLLVVAGVLGDATMAFFVGAYTASEGVRWAYLRWQFRPLDVPRHVDWRRAGLMIREASPYAALTVLGVIYVRIDLVMLEAMVGGDEVGYYAGATRVLFMLNTLPGIMLGVLFPRFARLQHEGHPDAGALYLLTTRAIGWLGLVFPLVLIVVAVPVLTALYGPAYAAAGPSMRWLMVALFFMFLHAPNATVLFSGRNLGVIVGLSCLTAGFNVITNFYAIPIWGAAGAAATTAASELLSLLVFTPIVWARLQVRPSKALKTLLLPRFSRSELTLLLGRR